MEVTIRMTAGTRTFRITAMTKGSGWMATSQGLPIRSRPPRFVLYRVWKA